MKVFLFIALLILVIMTGCTQVPMGDANMAVNLGASKKSPARSSKERSAELKAKYVAPHALSDFTKALGSERRDSRKHGVYVETLDSGEPVAMMNEDLVLYSGRDPSLSISDAKRAGEALRQFGVRRVNGSLVVIGEFDCNHN